MAPTLDIVIVNWNAGALLQRCIASIAETQTDLTRQLRIVVVDNGSHDDSWRGLDAGPCRLEVIRNAENIGFAAACNQGARGSTADHLLFLNPDTRLTPGSLEAVMAYLDSPEGVRAGIAGCRLLGEDGALQRSCARFPLPSHLIGRIFGLDRVLPGWVPPHFLTLDEHRGTRVVDQVMGAFLMIRRPLFEALGGFDERFFVYYDDVDLCLRAQQAGWSTIYLADVAIVHTGCGTTEQVRDRRLFYNLRSRMLYVGKHHRGWAAAAVAAATLLAEPLVRLALSARRRSLDEARQVMRGTAMLMADLPRCLRVARGEDLRQREK